MSSKFKIIYPNAFHYLDKKQFKTFLKINDSTVYECSKDAKGDGFLVGLRLTTKEWIEKFFFILKESNWSLEEVNSMPTVINTLLGGNENTINFISDFFSISIQKATRGR